MLYSNSIAGLLLLTLPYRGCKPIIPVFRHPLCHICVLSHLKFIRCSQLVTKQYFYVFIDKGMLVQCLFRLQWCSLATSWIAQPSFPVLAIAFSFTRIRKVDNVEVQSRLYTVLFHFLSNWTREQHHLDRAIHTAWCIVLCC